jgi:hypothetical protein
MNATHRLLSIALAGLLFPIGVSQASAVPSSAKAVTVNSAQHTDVTKSEPKAYWKGYRSGYRQGVRDGNQDCGSGGSQWGQAEGGAYSDGWTDGYSEGFSSIC